MILQWLELSRHKILATSCQEQSALLKSVSFVIHHVNFYLCHLDLQKNKRFDQFLSRTRRRRPIAAKDVEDGGAPVECSKCGRNVSSRFRDAACNAQIDEIDILNLSEEQAKVEELVQLKEMYANGQLNTFKKEQIQYSVSSTETTDDLGSAISHSRTVL